MRAMQIVVAHKDTDDGNCEFINLHTHLCSNALWEVTILGELKSNNKQKDKVRIAVTKSDGNGVAVVELVNADASDKLIRGKQIPLQMVAFPEIIDYYSDEEDYFNNSTLKSGNDTLVIGDGAVRQLQLFYPATPDYIYAGPDEKLEDLMLIRGSVIDCVNGYFGVDDYYTTFIKATIKTRFGPLDIVHSYEEIDKSKYGLLKPGSIIAGVFKLSGDVFMEFPT